MPRQAVRCDLRSQEAVAKHFTVTGLPQTVGLGLGQHT